MLVLIPDGPGTTVEVRDGLQGLPSAPRGTSALVGQYTSGPVTHAALATTPEQARLFSGEADDAFEASACLSDLYSESAPPVLIGRVTDGTELPATARLWDRSPSRSFSRRNPALNAVREPFATASAHNGGRWGGRKRVLVGDLAAPATDITSTAIVTGVAMLPNVWAGAILHLQGDSTVYEVVSNDSTGTVYIKGLFSQAALDADGTGTIDGRWRMVLGHDLELSVVVGQDSVSQKLCSVQALRKFKTLGDWEVVSSYDNLGVSDADSRPWVKTVTEGESLKYQMALSTSYDGATVEAKLPANYCEVPTGVSGPTMTLQWYRWAKTHAAGAGNAHIVDISPGDATQVEPHVYTITFTAATAFNVAVTWPDGTSQDLAAGTAGVSYVAGHPQLANFKVVAGSSAMVAGDILTLRLEPLPHDLYRREPHLYPIALSADGNQNQRLRIVANTYNTVSVRSDLDLADYGALESKPASLESATDLTAVSTVATTTVIMTPDGLATTTFTIPGIVTGVTAIAAALTTLDTQSVYIFDANPAAPTKLRVRLRDSFGSKSTIAFGAGTAHAALGLPTTGTVAGTDGRPARIEARMPMWGGYDGETPGTARYLIALDQTDHLFRRYMNTNLGLVTVGTPGVHDSSVKAAVRTLVDRNGWMGVAEFDPEIEAEATPAENAIANMLSGESESDGVIHFFPSRAKFLNTSKTKLVMRSITGLYMGIRSRLANIGTDGERGFHIAAANNNTQGRLSPRVQGLSDDLGRWSPPIKIMNDHGIVPLLWEGPDVFMYGNRLFSKGRTEKGNRYTITERAVYYHVARDLFTTTRPFIFKSISVGRLGDVVVALREKMRPYYEDGWFSDFGGTKLGFEQQVSVQVPPSLNPPDQLLEGNVTGSVTFRPKSSLENLKFIISPASLNAE